jgi:hypothetical protein
VESGDGASWRYKPRLPHYLKKKKVKIQRYESKFLLFYFAIDLAGFVKNMVL